MKNILFLSALLCASLGQLSAQTDNREIVSDTAYVQYRTSPDTAWFYVRNITYTDGGFSSSGLRIGDTTAMRTYLINQVIDVQRGVANAIQTLANTGVTNSALTRFSTMMEQVTGKTYFIELANSYAEPLLGRYSINVTGQSIFQADLVRVSSGALRLRRVDNPATLYTVSLLSDRSMRITSLPGASGTRDVAFRLVNSNGRKVYSNQDRTVRLTRVDGPTFTAQSR